MQSKEKSVNHLVCLDNSLKEIASDPLRSRKRMQQYSPFYTSSSINNFHCRYELNKAGHNKTSSIAPILTIIFVTRVTLHYLLLIIPAIFDINRE